MDSTITEPCPWSGNADYQGTRLVSSLQTNSGTLCVGDAVRYANGHILFRLRFSNTQAGKHAKGIYPGCETQGRRHQKSKTGVSVASRKGLMSCKNQTKGFQHPEMTFYVVEEVYVHKGAILHGPR